MKEEKEENREKEKRNMKDRKKEQASSFHLVTFSLMLSE